MTAAVAASNAYNMLSCSLPRRMRVRDLGLIEAGFRGAPARNEVNKPDELRVLNNAAGNGSMTSPRLRVWLKVTASETNFYTDVGAPANNLYVEPDELLIWWNRGTSPQTWTVTPTNFYTLPSKNITP